MKVLHTIACMSPRSGGTSSCTESLTYALNALDVQCDIFALRVQGESFDTPFLHMADVDCITSYGYSRNFIRLLKTAGDYDLYHTNGTWMHCNHLTAAVARRKGIPYMITPHGMLYPQSWAIRRMLKNLAWYLQFRKDFESAACVHLTCDEEKKYFLRLPMRKFPPIAVIPNAVPVPDFVKDIKPDRSVRRVGYLGRLHSRKGVDKLIQAWSQVSGNVPGTELCIIGDGAPEYEALLRAKVNALGLKNVDFCGFLEGRAKFEKLASLRALCNPSNFENFGMVIGEALCVKTPVISGTGAPWKVLQDIKAGWWIDPTVEQLTHTIDDVMSMSEPDLQAMGERGKNLIETVYSPRNIAMQLKDVYRWLLNGGTRPETVSLN